MKRKLETHVRSAVERLRGRSTETAPAAPEIERWLIERIARELEVKNAEIRTDVPIERYGLDSRIVAAIAGDLEEWLRRPLEATLLWDFPTIRDVSAYLAAEDGASGSAAAS